MSPVYQHRCTVCAFEYTKLSPMSEAGKDDVCPRCGELAENVICAPNVDGGMTPKFHEGKHSQDPKFIQQWNDLQEEGKS